MTSGRTTTTRPSQAADFDEQLWPVNLAILVLAAVAAAIIVARGNFDPAQTRLLDNGYLQLGVVGLLIGTLFVAARWLRTRMARRVQLCILFSLLVHLGLAVYLHGHYLAFLAQRELHERQVLAERRERITIPDYQSHHPDQPPMPQSFERPVETEVPDQPGVEPADQPVVPQDTPVDRPEPTEPEAPEPQQPSPAEMRRAQLAPPRRDEAAAGGQISRQPWEHRPKPDEPVPMPEIRPAGRQTPATVQPQAARLERQETTSPSRQRQTFEPPAGELRPNEALALARQANPSAPTADVPSTPIPMRQLALPSDVPRAEVEPPEPTQAVEPARLADLESQAAAAQRQLDLPAQGRSFAEAAPAMRRAAPLAAVRRRRPDQLPDLVQTTAPVAVRQPRPRPMTAVAAVAEPARPPEAAIAGRPGDLESPASQAIWQVTRAASVPTGVTAGQGDRPLPRSADTARLGPALGPRAAATSEPSGQPILIPLGRSRLVRVDRGMGMPLGAGIVDDVSPSPAPGPSGPGRVQLASPATVQRAALLSVGTPTVAASRGGAEIGSGLGQLAARMGRPRARQAAFPSLDSTASPQPAARTGARPYLPEAGVETAPLGDTAGMAVEEGGRPGPLEIGPQAAIRPGPAALPTGRVTLAATSEGTRPGVVAAVAMAGRLRFGDEGLSTPGIGLGSAIVRTTAAGPAVLTDVAVAIPEGAPTGMSGAAGNKGLQGGAYGPDEPAVGVAAPVAGEGIDGLPAAWRSGRQRPLAQSAASHVVGPRLGPSGRADATQRGPLVAGVAVPARSAGRLPTAELAAPTGPEVAAPASGEGSVGQGVPVGLEAGPLEPGREISGLPGSRDWQASPGSLAAAGPMSLTPGTATGPRRLPGDGQGPALAARVGGGPPRKANTAGLPRGLAETAEEVTSTGSPAESSGELDVAGGGRVGGPSRREGGLPVRIAAALGPGGLSTNPAPVVGIPGRRARPESQAVHSVPQRFLVRKSGGRLAIDGRVRQPSPEAFRQRDPGRRAQMLGQYGPTRGSERAVEMGLEFLAAHQFPDGHWSLERSPREGQPEYDDFAPAQIRADTAATGLALLSFLGAGYTHMDNKHRAVVRKGIGWLVANQQPDGQLFTIPTDTERAGRIYGHGIGSIALCEAYGMTRDPELREPAAQAIQFIIDAQHPTQGGWRYTKKDDAKTWRKESDTSVSGWQLMALKSAQMAGLEVPAEVMEKVGQWLDLAQADEGARYIYNPYASDAPDQRHGRLPNLAMTAEGLLMRMYLGWDRLHPAMIRGADYLKENLPDVGAPELPLRDVYYWYYATQVMFQMQDDHWTAWNDRLRALLINSQEQDGPLAGSWHPDRPVRDRWAHAGGRLYVTTMNLLMLEVYYRHLPLFQTLVDDAVAGSQ